LNVNEFQEWIKAYYEERGWSELDIFIRIGFSAQETGEVARAIRALEIGRDRPDESTGTSAAQKRELVEELGDVLGNIIVIANKYDLTSDSPVRNDQ
jgi:NTP pyrophosphatase (non-canonical NTP hydrolase)